MTRALSKDYSNAGPTLLEPADAEALLRELLAEARSLPGHDEEVAEALYSMLGRFGDIYAHPSRESSMDVLAWVNSHWASDPAPYVDCLCSILATLELPEARQFAVERAARETGETRRMLMEVMG